MIKIGLFVYTLFVTSLAGAFAKSECAKNSLVMDGSIASVISRDGVYDSNLRDLFRYRATVVRAVRSEGGVVLVLEKYTGGSSGTPEKVAYLKRFDVTSLPGVTAATDKAIKKSAESMYGCCSPVDMKWEKDMLEFNVRIGDQTFKCQTTSLDAAAGPQITCK